MRKSSAWNLRKKGSELDLHLFILQEVQERYYLFSSPHQAHRLMGILLLNGIVDDVRTYFQSTTDYFFIPSLSVEVAKIN